MAAKFKIITTTGTPPCPPKWELFMWIWVKRALCLNLGRWSKIGEYSSENDAFAAMKQRAEPYVSAEYYDQYGFRGVYDGW